MGSYVNVGDLVQPDWTNATHDWDYFDILPSGYTMWKKGEIGIVLSVKNKRSKKNCSCEILHPNGILISYRCELTKVNNE